MFTELEKLNSPIQQTLWTIFISPSITFFLNSVLRIRIQLFYLNANPDPGNENNAEFLHE
jgi:hypothetical protein